MVAAVRRGAGARLDFGLCKDEVHVDGGEVAAEQLAVPAELAELGAVHLVHVLAHAEGCKAVEDLFQVLCRRAAARQSAPLRDSETAWTSTAEAQLKKAVHVPTSVCRIRSKLTLCLGPQSRAQLSARLGG